MRQLQVLSRNRSSKGHGMIEFIPDWIEWLFLITGMVMWVGGCATVLIMLCLSESDA